MVKIVLLQRIRSCNSNKLSKRTKSLLISFSGVDGSGKTAHARALARRISNLGLPCTYCWGGWRPIFSYPFLAVARLLGYTKRVKVGKRVFFKRNYNYNKAIGMVWRCCLFIDCLINYFVIIRIPLFLTKIVVCDRYIYDIIVELMESKLYTKGFGALILQAFPKPQLAFLMDVPENIAWMRLFDYERNREQPLYNLSSRRKIYLTLSNKFNFSIIDCTNNFTSNQQRICQEVFRRLKIRTLYRRVILNMAERHLWNKMREKYRSKRGSPSKFLTKSFNKMCHCLFKVPDWNTRENKLTLNLGVDMFGRDVAEGVVRYVELLKKRGLIIHTAIVLGSRAKGRWNPESDVDVLIIASNMPKGIKKKFTLFDTSIFMGIEPDGCTKEEFLLWVEQLNLKALDAIYYGKVVYDDGFWSKAKKKFKVIEEKYKLKKTKIEKALLYV